MTPVIYPLSHARGGALYKKTQPSHSAVGATDKGPGVSTHLYILGKDGLRGKVGVVVVVAAAAAVVVVVVG